MRPFCRNSCSTRLTCTGDNATVSASSCCVMGKSQALSVVSSHGAEPAEHFTQQMRRALIAGPLPDIDDPLARDRLIHQRRPPQCPGQRRKLRGDRHEGFMRQMRNNRGAHGAKAVIDPLQHVDARRSQVSPGRK